MIIDNNKLKVIESENLYEPYEGRRTGYRYRLEYSTTRDEDSLHKIVVTTKEIGKGSKETNVEIKITCKATGLFEVVKFLSKDLILQGKCGHIEFAKKLSIKGYEKL